MGVHGLWRLIEPSGKPVPLESLENKILAVDVSIWLHQAVKGFQDSKGAPVPNAHLLGIYHRVCKLLFFKIKPIFIFDGGVPVLKKQTIAKRNQLKSRNLSEAEILQKQLISTLLKHSAVTKVLSEKTKASLTLPARKTSKHDNMYVLPSPELDSTISSSEEDESTTETSDSSPTKHWDVHTIDMSSGHFKSLPVDVRHEILTELKETRKQSSWGRLHELPKQSDDFSSYQVNRLLKRQAVQSALEDAEKEMGGYSLSLGELESILKDHGVVTTHDMGKRIASDENTRLLYIKDVKQALEKARREQEKLDAIQEEESEENSVEPGLTNKSKADLEFEDDLEKAIALSLQEEPSTSKIKDSSGKGSQNEVQSSFLENFNDADFESDVSDEVIEVPVKKKFSSAESYMIEYSGLTPNEINKILEDKNVASKGLKAKSIQRVRSIISNEQDNMGNGNKNSFDFLASKGGKSVFKEPDSSSKNTDSEPNEVIGAVVSTQSDIRKAAAESTQIDDMESRSDTSSDVEFEEVTENIKPKNTSSIEIVIDPNRSLEDDLFNDIFNKSDEEKPDLVQTDVDEHLVATVCNKMVEQAQLETLEDEKTSKRTIDEKQTEECEVSSTNVDIESTLVLKNYSENKIEDRMKDAYEKTGQQRSRDAEIQTLEVEEMTKLKDDLQKEKIDILVEKSVKERMASNITDQMYQEAQDLLELFGVPYIVAPMEAEAQCAFLDAIDLTDGTITDDSDIWLFGGRTVYKNFFNQSKYVMEFKVENIKHHFKLPREQMILLALLVGSDYTVGLQGVGPVTALEILAAFPPGEAKEFSLSHTELLSGLREFRSWFTKGKTSGLGRTALKNKLKNIAFTDNFPSLQVVQAYLEPTVETSREKFTWSKPDFVGLTDFAKEKFGWSPRKTEEILKPVIKKVEASQAQRSIKNYFKTVYKADSTNAQNQMSKRVKSAVNRIGKTQEELIAEEMEAISKEKQKKTRTRRAKSKTSDSADKEEQAESKVRRPRKKKIEEVPSTSNTDTSEKVEESKVKKPRNKSKKTAIPDSETISNIMGENSNKLKEVDEDSEDIKKYENIALELKKRRQKRNALPKKVEIVTKKQNKPPVRETPPTEVLPEILEDDEEIQLLKITTSKSLKRTEEIDEEAKRELEQQVKKTCLPERNVHQREVIHQKLRDKSNLLRNKMKAIEVFRKSKKGPGYIPKREKNKVLPKQEAELSENSSDD